MRLYRQHRPDILLLDMRLPDISRIDVITRIRQRDSAAKIIVVTTYLEDVQVSQALKAGAKGYLLKAGLRNDLISAIHGVHAGKLYVAPEVARELSHHQNEEQLTVREVQVLRLVSLGCSNHIIAERLGIGDQTVEAHLRAVLSKLPAQDCTHAIAIALKRGILDSSSTDQ